jgi:hypothetical protein
MTVFGAFIRTVGLLCAGPLSEQLVRSYETGVDLETVEEELEKEVLPDAKLADLDAENILRRKLTTKSSTSIPPSRILYTKSIISMAPSSALSKSSTFMPPFAGPLEIQNVHAALRWFSKSRGQVAPSFIPLWRAVEASRCGYMLEQERGRMVLVAYISYMHLDRFAHGKLAFLL